MSALAEFCAYWFVCKRLGIEAEQAPAANARLDPGLNRAAFAREVAEAVDDASMRTWPYVVEVDKSILVAECTTADDVFQARDALLASAFLKERSKDPEVGFADYIASRWIWRFVLKHEVRRRPLRAPFPANYDARRKQELVDALERTFLLLNLPLDVAELRKSIDKWKDLGDVRSSVLTHASKKS